MSVRNSLSLLILLSCSLPTTAQLRISEVLYDTTGDESAWEWFEITNAGTSSIDLDGYVFDDFSITNNAQTEPNILNVASGGNSAVTEIESGGVAVVYNGASLGFDESRFRNAWKLNASVPLIGVSDFESLNNGNGDTFGLWASLEDYNQDLANTDDDDQLEVSNFRSAAAWLDYAAESFPSASEASIEWNGTGDYQDGSNWVANNVDTPRITTSVQTLLPTSPLNSENDLASPGVVAAVGEANGLLITEILYNPASSEPNEWEFIEILNGTGSDIDFTATPYIFDDKASGPLSEPNINSGSVADGEIAVLFRDSTSLEDMQTAWGDDINLIAVGAWSALNNSDDTIGIWDNFESYLSDSPADGERTYDEAVATLTYGLVDWPIENDGQSINLVDLEADLDDATNWITSVAEDGISESPQPVFSADLIDHSGGDLGTPGSFGDVVVDPINPPSFFSLDVNDDGSVNADDSPLLCDAITATGVSITEELTAAGLLLGDTDLNGTVDFADFLTLSSNFGSTSTHFGQGDVDCNNAVDFADFLAVSNNFGQTAAAISSVPEPDGAVWSLFWVFCLALTRNLLFSMRTMSKR